MVGFCLLYSVFFLIHCLYYYICLSNQVPIQSLRDIVDLMRKNETSFPHFRNSNTYKLFEPPVFENKKKASGYFF